MLGFLICDGRLQAIALNIQGNPLGVVFGESVVKLEVLHFQIEKLFGKVLLPPPVTFGFGQVGGTVGIHDHTDLRPLHGQGDQIHLLIEKRDNS